jgi:hypothetical protein
VGRYPKVFIDEAILLCNEILAGTDDAVKGEHLGHPCLYGKKRDANVRHLDGKTANIAYSRDKIRKN